MTIRTWSLFLVPWFHRLYASTYAKRASNTKQTKLYFKAVLMVTKTLDAWCPIYNVPNQMKAKPDT